MKKESAELETLQEPKSCDGCKHFNGYNCHVAMEDIGGCGDYYEPRGAK